MAKLNILVSAVGGDLGQSVIKCLKDSGYESRIIGCDMNPYAAGKADVDTFLQAPPVKEKQKYSDFLLQTLKKHKINYVFLLADVEIIFYNENRELFNESRAVFLVSEPHIIDTFMDKFKTVEFFREKGILYPRTWLPSSYSGQLGFPLILKKRRGSGSQELFKVNNGEELQFYLKHRRDMIIQEYLPGEDNEYTAGIFSDGKNIHTITFKRTLAAGGFSRQVEPVWDEAITTLPEGIAGVLDFKGSINVQFRNTEKGCIPFEINPRFSSTVYFRHLFGFPDVKWNLDMWEGKTVTFSSTAVKKGIGVRKFSEVIFENEN